jgi:hypothetical protein
MRYAWAEEEAVFGDRGGEVEEKEDEKETS